jgi:hypothetical protein
MILRLSDSLSRGVVAVGAVLVAVWVCFFGVRSGIAGREAEGDSKKQLERAVRLESRNPEYWYRLGHYQQFNLDEPDLQASIRSLGKAVELNPGYTEAWLDLGTAYELNGDTTDAGNAFGHAKKTYPASADVAWRYGNFLLRQGDPPGALSELKLTLKSDPRRAGAAFSRVYRAAPNINALLDDLLPPVPEAYISAIAEAVDSHQLAVAETMWMRLLTLKPKLEILDFSKLVSALLDNGDYAAARRVWDQGTGTMSLPALIQPQGSVLWDPSFESGITNEPFAWNIKPLEEGMHTEYDTQDKLSGKQSLRLTFDGKHNPSTEAACALGVVTPGTKYLFSGWVKAREITGDQGVRFHLRAVGNINVPVSSSKDVRGTATWTLVDAQWTAAPGVHRIEVCVSREPSTNADIHISGDAWVDDVTLVPEAAEHRRP